MAGTDTVRASRDGDQFHYRWAARQTLQLLRPGTDLVLITIEGVAPDGTQDYDGVQVIDMAEYRGGAGLAEATSVVYRQLKHSTAHPGVEQTVSDLKTTVAGFAGIFRDIANKTPGAKQKIRFEFVSNRPVRSTVPRAIDGIASGVVPADAEREARFLRAYAGFEDNVEAEADFFGRFTVDPSAPGLLNLDTLFRSDVAGLLPGTTDLEHLQLKEMVEQRATSLQPDSRIDRGTVLAALRVGDDQLLPAPNLIIGPTHLVVTEQSREVLAAITAPEARTILVHAAGGVGKSVLTTQIQRSLPAGSLTLVYDCFGAGQYRMLSQPRHPHRKGLTQLANELAAHTLCEALIPTAHAQPSDYMSALMARLRVAAEAIATRAPDALLTVVIDAADNAAQLAHSLGERSFVTDLLREDVPSNTRIVMLCRTERIELLEPPSHVRRIELGGFTTDDSRELLRSAFGHVAENKVSEFHRMTGGNPRVQAFALESADTIEACLATLGRAIPIDGRQLDVGELLRSRVARCKDLSPAAPAEIDSICEAISALRPRIPIQVLSALCNVPEALVRSFVADLSRPLLVDGDCVQFRDEPTETWFRTTYRPTGDKLDAFIARLTPLASSQPYAAASLPELLWEADQLDVLVQLAMTDAALPEGNDLEQREIAQQRSQYALKAALRAGRDVEAARVALKAGVLAAGRSRTLTMFRSNPDLAGRFLDAQVVEDLVSTRGLAAEWPGSHLQYEGSLLSVAAGQADLAASRLRTARDMQFALARATPDTRNSQPPRKHPVTTEGIAEVAFGLLHNDSVDACVTYLTRWRPNRVGFDAGQIVARRLVDAGNVEQWERLGLAAAHRAKYLQFAVADAGWHGNLVCNPPLARSLSTMLRQQRRPVSFRWGGHRDDSLKIPPQIPTVVWIVAMGVRHHVLTPSQVEQILRLHLPATLGHGAGSRWSTPVEPLLCGFALLAQARRQPYDIDGFAGPDVVKAKSEQQPHTHYQVLDDHNRNVVPLAVWATLWAETMTNADGHAGDDGRIGPLLASRRGYSGHDIPHVLIRGIARLGSRIVSHQSSTESKRQFLEWYRSTRSHLGTGVQTDVVHAACAAPDASTNDAVAALVLTAAQDVSTTLENMLSEAQERVAGMVALTRAIQRFDPAEAGEYFHRAIQLTDRVGDDAFSRWRTLLALTTAAADPTKPDHRRAYRIAQLIEGFEPYVGEAIEHSDALASLGRLSASSAIAAASRWRIRGFCSALVFTRALGSAGSPLMPSPIIPMALSPFDLTTDETGRLERALRHDPRRAPRILRVAGEATWRHAHGASYYDTVDRVVDELGLTTTGTRLCPTVRRTARSHEHPATATTSWDVEGMSVRAQQLAAESEMALSELAAQDLTAVDGWEHARTLTRPHDGPLLFDRIVEQAAAYPPSRLADVVAAFLEHPGFSLWEYKAILERFVDLPLLPRAARNQLRRLATQATTRFSLELATDRYGYLDFSDLARAVGLDTDLQRDALIQVGSLPVPLDADQCFELATRLASRLPTDAAQVALDDLSVLLSSLAPDDSADGLYDRFAPVPPTNAECLAGYLWAALGDPETDVRWRAAHTVRLLIELGCRDEVSALNRFATGNLDPAPFVDVQLPFYDKHALLWLLLAIARSAHEPSLSGGLETFIPLLEQVAFVDPPHVLLRAAAASALLGLAAAGVEAVTAETTERARAVNVPINVLAVSRHDRPPAQHQQESAPAASEDGQEPDTQNDVAAADAARFFWDFTEYWCDDVADAFGLSSQDVARMAGSIVTDRWRQPLHDGRIKDPRRERGLYNNQKTDVYKSSWPDFETLDFYLATHALWTVAGTLVGTRPVYRDPQDDVDDFTHWLRQLLPSRGDGRWLADRRDPPPHSIFSNQNEDTDADWMWRLNRNHFAERLLADDWITVWERSTDATHEAREQVTVRSALVAPDRARALLVALQTAPSNITWRIPQSPSSDHDHDPKVPGFELTGWINDPESPVGFDDRDPLAASLDYPPPHPNSRTQQLLDLKPDTDMRIWTGAGSRPAFRSSVWSNLAAPSNGRQSGCKGDQLQIHRDALSDLLTATGNSLVVVVTIERTHEQRRRRNQSIGDDNELPYLEPSFNAYLIDESGRTHQL